MGVPHLPSVRDANPTLDLLHRWRSVTKAVYDATVGSGEDDPWYCHLDYKRPNAGCDQPDNYNAGAA